MAVRKLARKVTRTGRVRAVAATPAQARAHVFAPAHVKKAQTEEVDPKREVNFRMPRRRAKVARGATVDLGARSYDYENMNFGLCRLLISTISGAVPKNSTYTPSYLNDAFWDLNTINAYRAYMQAKVFTPSGVAIVPERFRHAGSEVRL
jgi:hypothetical protein